MVKNYVLTYCPNILNSIHKLVCVLFLILAFIFSGNIYGQSIIGSQSFDNGASGFADNLSFQVFDAPNIGTTNGTFVSSPNSLIFTNNSNTFNQNSFARFQNIDISAFTNVSITVSFRAVRVDTGEDLFLEVSYDNGINYTQIKLVDGDDFDEFIDWNTPDRDGTTATNPYTFNIPAGKNQLRMLFQANNLEGNEAFYIDNVIVSGTRIGYCPSNGSTTDNFNTGTRLVKFNTINNETPIENNAYSDFTGISTSVTKGTAYNLNVQVNTDGNFRTHSFAWIDWNQDNDFDDPGETFDLGEAVNVSNGLTSLSPKSITIPANAKSGVTRMRVSTKYLNDPTSCERGFDGEVEDYSINVEAAYCISNGNKTDAFNTGTRLVKFNTINNATPNENNDYSDFTGISTTVTKGAAYNLNVQANTGGTGTTHSFAWIDWNGDKDFDDAGETFDLGTTTTNANGLTTLSPRSITIPTNAVTGATRMRVSTKFNSDPTSCEQGFDGEVEDYTIDISPYCFSNGNKTDAFNTGTRLVNFNTINNATPIENNDYSDFTGISTTVSKGVSYNLNVKVNTDGNVTTHTFAWIDWNKDGDFNDVGETFDLGTATNVFDGLTSLSPFSIKIPTNAVVGTTRMRVSTKYLNDPTSCEQGFDGEVEDYSINIQDTSIITATISPTSYCVGAAISVPYTITGTFNTGNVFTAQLSNATGSFATPTNIGTLTSTAAGTIAATIPTSTAAGTAYRIRVISNNPSITGSVNTSNLSINAIPAAPTASNNGPICIGGTLNLTASNITGATYSWTGPNGFTSSLQNPTINNVDSSNSGDYFVIATVNGCASESGITNVVINSFNSWTGAVSTNWNTLGNWSCNKIPGLTSDVVIPSGITNYPILNTGAIGTVRDLLIEANASLKILDNTLQITGTTNNAGVFDAINGGVEFRASTLQQIPATIFLDNKIRNLTINNSAGVNSNAIISVTGILNVILGDFQTGGNLSLISNSTQTALIDGSGSGNILGNVTMQRYLDPAMGYKYFSSPFQNTIVGDYASVIDLSATFPTFYRYVENRKDSQNRAATGFESYTSSTSSVNVLAGYALNFGSVAVTKTVEITGVVNNRDQQISLSHNDGLYTKGFNLVGNPYPSPIDWIAASGWTKTNVDDAIYFFTASAGKQYEGVYSSYVNGVQSGGGSSGNIIPSMQGFFVHVTDSPTNTYPVTATLGTTNQVRITNFDKPFYKSPEEEYFNLIRLNAKFDNLPLSDETVIYFNRNASEDFDRDLDALKLLNTNNLVPNFYTISSNEKMLSINALPSNFNAENLRIPLGFDVENEGWISISLSNENQFTANAHIYLIDLEKRKSIDLRDIDTYRFYADSGKDDTRFQIVFAESRITNPDIIFNELFSVDQSLGSVKIKMNLDIGKIGDIRVTTITGQLLETQFVAGKDEVEITGIKSSGVYLITLYSDQGNFTKKILIKK